MSYRKFGKNDVLINTMKAHPKSEFLIYSGTIYYNNRGWQYGEFQSSSANPASIWMCSPGNINLYEYNIDRLSGSDGRPNPLIYPYIVKNGSRAMFFVDGTETEDFWTGTELGDPIKGYYPQTASIRREFFKGTQSGSCHGGDTHRTKCRHKMNYWSLRTMLDHYGTLSPHYLVSSSYGSGDSEDGWNKDTQNINLIHIPSIFYGSKIRPGTVAMQWYYSGSLIGELKDERENGELIQTGPRGSLHSGSVAGVVMYTEGFILLTGSWNLPDDDATGRITLETGNLMHRPSWIYWGAGARDGVAEAHPTSTGGNSLLTASFGLSFEGITKTEVITMYARANKGEVNYSNNPTFLEYNQEQLTFTSSHVYEENKNRLIKNTVSSSYKNHEANFKRQVYISKVAVYDDKKQLIGMATLSNPVLKEEDQDLAIKIKLDI